MNMSSQKLWMPLPSKFVFGCLYALLFLALVLFKEREWGISIFLLVATVACYQVDKLHQKNVCENLAFFILSLTGIPLFVFIFWGWDISNSAKFLPIIFIYVAYIHFFHAVVVTMFRRIRKGKPD